MELVIMAAGMGSRFGGLKQIEPVDDNGCFIIDYSIYDAIKAGFNKIVFIIKEENYDIFRETVGKRIEGKIDVEYVFQKIDNVPNGVIIPSDRIKPWGTAHAIYCCKDVVKENFAIINADDFYGRDAYIKMAEFLKNDNNPRNYSMIGYKVINTLTENGSVKRGVCDVENNCLSGIVESSIEKVNDKIIASPLNGNDSFEVKEDTYVSMNLWGFKTNIFKYLEEDFNEFFEENKNNLEKCEFLIPDVVFKKVLSKDIDVKVIPTSSVWHGVTYKEDKEDLVNSIKELVSKNEYPNNLWN